MGRKDERLEQADVVWPCSICGPKTKASFSRGQLKKGRGNGICTQCSSIEKAPAPGGAAVQQTLKQRQPQPVQQPLPRQSQISARHSNATSTLEFDFEPLPQSHWHAFLDLRSDSSSEGLAGAKSKSTLARPSASLEAERLRAVRELGETFRDQCAVLGEAKWYQHYENWLWASRGAHSTEDEMVVPVIPRLPLLRASFGHGNGACGGASSSATSLPAQDELARRLEHRGLSAAAARAACDALLAKAAELCARIDALSTSELGCEEQSSRHMAEQRGATGKRKRAETQLAVVATREPADPRSLRLSCGDVIVSVREASLHKLWALYASARTSSSVNATDGGRVAHLEALSADGNEPAALHRADRARFLEAAFCVLARLLALQGGHSAAGGMQLACPSAVFDTLRDDLGVSSELFASPLNCRHPRFCSASADVDSLFGSRGSFFCCAPTSGAFLANPPFDPLVVAAMARRMQRLLAAADAANARLTFVITMPHWQMPRGPHLPAWRSLRDSAFTTSALVLAKGRHFYVDQQGAPSPSRHETSVMLLQSREAAKEAPFTEAMQARLRSAFAMQSAGSDETS